MLANLSGLTLIIPDVGFRSELLFGLDRSTFWSEKAMFPVAGTSFSWSSESSLVYLELNQKKKKYLGIYVLEDKVFCFAVCSLHSGGYS